MIEKNDFNLAQSQVYNVYKSQNFLHICGKWTLPKRDKNPNPDPFTLCLKENWQEIKLSLLPPVHQFESPVTVIIHISSISKKKHFHNIFTLYVNDKRMAFKETKVTFSPSAQYTYITFLDANVTGNENKPFSWSNFNDIDDVTIYFQMEELESNDIKPISLSDIMKKQELSHEPYFASPMFIIDPKLSNNNGKKLEKQIESLSFREYKEIIESKDKFCEKMKNLEIELHPDQFSIKLNNYNTVEVNAWGQM